MLMFLKGNFTARRLGCFKILELLGEKIHVDVKSRLIATVLGKPARGLNFNVDFTLCRCPAMQPQGGIPFCFAFYPLGGFLFCFFSHPLGGILLFSHKPSNYETSLLPTLARSSTVSARWVVTFFSPIYASTFLLYSTVFPHVSIAKKVQSKNTMPA
jgi:hypothetical protein